MSHKVGHRHRHGGPKVGQHVDDEPGHRIAVEKAAEQGTGLHDAATGKEQAKLLGGEPYTYDLVFSGDGKSLASVHGGQWVILWDVARRKERARLKPEADLGGASCVVFAPDGKSLTVGAT